MITCGSLSQKDSRKAKTQLKPTLVLPSKEKSRVTRSLVQQKGEKKRKFYNCDNKFMCLQLHTPE